MCKSFEIFKLHVWLILVRTRYNQTFHQRLIISKCELQIAERIYIILNKEPSSKVLMKEKLLTNCVFSLEATALQNS